MNYPVCNAINQLPTKLHPHQQQIFTIHKHWPHLIRMIPRYPQNHFQTNNQQNFDNPPTLAPKNKKQFHCSAHFMENM